ncbi:hypothetical protein HF313_21965 [Massilia atriviolacea]|uniref:Uncharacterized protein n=1 Tax=Massilia atriviolacea TaxID=2495579 RepID=A0A430HFF3_9BURK|nr:hypothetical protein [Massilia atriviolacea]RSZ56236.1 hypothetical protein EJB06_25400 [Massilia atriviolacea]
MHVPTRTYATPNATRHGLILILALAPGLLYVSGFWRWFFTPVSLAAGLGAALAGNLLLAPSMAGIAQRDIDRGMHASLRSGSRFPWGERLVLHCLIGLVCFGWMMSALWLCAMLVEPAISERAFRVEAVRQCSGPKCAACTTTASAVLRFESMRTALCVDHVQPPLREGESMIVRGYYHRLMIRIDSVRRAPGATPTSRP